jgi:predicted AlkP superfamily pyrophosphatase or phosphodiesterase
MISLDKAGSRIAIFLVDGMRPDGLLAADTPFLDHLLTRGAYTYRERTVMPSTTLTCHTSLFFSVPPEVHGILDNTWKPFPQRIPSLFDIIREANLAAASFFNWEPLRDLWRPGSPVASFFLKDTPEDGGRTDREVTALALSWLQSHDWALSFVYLHNTDKTGHAAGGCRRPKPRCHRQCRSLHREHLQHPLPKDTLVIVTSDHGGHDHINITPIFLRI